MSYAEANPRFRNGCAAVARWVDLRSAQLSRPLRGPVSLDPELEEIPYERAVQQGCYMLGEAVVFSISATVLTYEYMRQKENERNKAASERAAIETRCDALLEERCAELRAAVASLQEDGRRREE